MPVTLSETTTSSPDSSLRPAMTTTGFLPGQQALHLAAQGPNPLLELPPATAEGQQQGARGIAQHRLGRVHDLVDEQHAVLLDVDLAQAPLQRHEADDVLAPPAKPLSGRVRDETEHLDDGQHTLAGFRVDHA